MALQFYLDATNRLLQNPVPTPPLYKTADLTAYINLGRQQLAADSQCIRQTGTGTLKQAQQVYPFSTFTAFPLSTLATGTVFWSVNPSNGDTVTLNGRTITFVTGAPGANQVQISGTTALTVGQNLVENFLGVTVDPLLTVASYQGAGGPDTYTITITYNTPGTAGNAYTLAASAATPSGPHLTGGGVSIQGISGVLAVRQLSVAPSVPTDFTIMTNRPWAWFNAYYLSNGHQTLGTPSVWSQQGIGSAGAGFQGGGSFGVWPPPSIDMPIQGDCICLPSYLTTDADPETIPYPFTEAVPYWAAYYALLSSQRTQDATVMFQRYQEFVRRGVDMTAPPVLPDNYQGGRGAKVLASKGSVTERQQAGR